MIKATMPEEHGSLSSLTKNTDPWATMLHSLSTMYSAGMAIDWAEYHRDFDKALSLLALPTYSFEIKNFWIDYLNNWSLNKGEKQNDVAAADKLPELCTTSVQKVIRQDVNPQKQTAYILAESNFALTLLREAVAGHLINGAALCPSAIYADMAMTVCEYSYKLLSPRGGISIWTFEIWSILNPYW